MKFAVMLRESGIDVKDFPNCSEIPIVLYDGKNRVYQKEDIQFSEKLFKANPKSFDKFLSLVRSLEETPTQSMNVYIDELEVIVFYRTEEAKHFWRKMTLDPLDFMV